MVSYLACFASSCTAKRFIIGKSVVLHLHEGPDWGHTSDRIEKRREKSSAPSGIWSHDLSVTRRVLYICAQNLDFSSRLSGCPRSSALRTSRSRPWPVDGDARTLLRPRSARSRAPGSDQREDSGRETRLLGRMHQEHGRRFRLRFKYPALRQLYGWSVREKPVTQHST